MLLAYKKKLHTFMLFLLCTSTKCSHKMYAKFVNKPTMTQEQKDSVSKMGTMCCGKCALWNFLKLKVAEFPKLA